MPESIPISPATDQLELGMWNIFLDLKHGERVASQSERIQSIVTTILDLDKRFDVFVVLEAQKTDQQHNGELLAELTGYSPGVWHSYSRKAAGEQIGMFGDRVQDVEVLPLKPGKKALITKIGPVAVAGTHLKYQVKGPEKANQSRTLMELMADEEHGVIMLDTNSLFWQKSRRIIEDAGYTSAFKLLDKPKLRPQTIHVPGNQYRPHLPLPLRTLVPFGLSIDDIYVKGVPVLDAYAFAGDSDHSGLGVTLDVSSLRSTTIE